MRQTPGQLQEQCRNLFFIFFQTTCNCSLGFYVSEVQCMRIIEDDLAAHQPHEASCVAQSATIRGSQPFAFCVPLLDLFCSCVPPTFDECFLTITTYKSCAERFTLHTETNT